jgi:hypothetical protein
MSSRVSGETGALENVCRACIAGLPVDGGAFTLMSPEGGRQTLAASDKVVAAVEELQFLLGEGPSLQVFESGRPSLIPDLDRQPATWPVLQKAVAELPLRALFTFPIHLGTINLGVCVLYRREPGSLSTGELALILDGIDTTTVALLALRAGHASNGINGDAGGGDQANPAPIVEAGQRRQVHQATGMLMVHLGLSAEGAFARLRSTAFAEGRPLDEVAGDIMARRISFDGDSQSDDGDR